MARSGALRLWLSSLLIVCANAWSDNATPMETSSYAPRIAIIIDDLGNLMKNGDRIIALDAPVACSILPHTPYAVRIARRAHAAGKEVMLHLPLQPVEQFEVLSAGTIQIDTTRSEMRRILDFNLASLPYVSGVNNHQGSLLTRHPGHMHWLMSELRSRGDLFFVDSYTTKASVALRMAREHGVPSTRRDVFLDHTQTTAAIDAQFRRLKNLARSRGVAVGIGHPHTVTVEYLERAIPQLRADGFELIPVSEAIALESQPIVQAATFDTQSLGR
ncbi:MAG: divergent polysaccharide deacetylase family protein [Gammaproteobacteria bacterium]|nr:divergent polysaccharide deacetylase family protein [Gammaproteobacteria bacterium]